MDVLTSEERATILSKGKYWEEVQGRCSCDGSTGQILRQELQGVISDLGLKVLWIILEYAEKREV